MDQSRFDSFTKALATAKTRRSLLGSLTALVAGVRAASAQSECPPGQARNKKGQCTCPAGTDACPDGCFNLKKDLANCGRCGCSCAGGECVKGECRGSGGVTCGTPTTTTTTTAAPGACSPVVGACGGVAVGCNENPDCSCFATVSGESACVVRICGADGCAADCGASNPCPTGEACIADTCEGNVCQPLCGGGGSFGIASAVGPESGPNTP